jgi:hypothetical protein
MKLLKKIQLLQFIIIIFFYILSSSTDEYEKLDKNCEYYTFLCKMVSYNKLTKKIIKKNRDVLDFNDNYKIFLNDNEYFYIFYSNNVYVYFFKERGSNKHNIYFNGINNMNDLNIIVKTVLEIINQNFNYDNINKLLNNDGYLYKFYDNSIIKIKTKYTIIEVFYMIYENVYNPNKDSNKIDLQIDGFSIGGPESQLFAILLLEKYENKLNITMHNIESWFGGNKEIYDKLNKKIKLLNIYNNKSIFYFFNIFWQKYFKTNFLIISKNNDNEKDEYEEMFDYGNKIFPLGIYDYIIDSHVLSKFLK